jgi:hypothetical protein
MSPVALEPRSRRTPPTSSASSARSQPQQAHAHWWLACDAGSRTRSRGRSCPTRAPDKFRRHDGAPQQPLRRHRSPGGPCQLCRWDELGERVSECPRRRLRQVKPHQQPPEPLRASLGSLGLRVPGLDGRCHVAARGLVRPSLSSMITGYACSTSKAPRVAPGTQRRRHHLVPERKHDPRSASRRGTRSAPTVLADGLPSARV